MVASLIERSLLAVRNAVETGRLTDVDSTPLWIRKSIFEAISAHRSLENRNCLGCLQRPRFFDGFDTIDLSRQDCKTEPGALLAEILPRKCVDSPQFAAGVRRLRVCVCVVRRCFDDAEAATAAAAADADGRRRRETERKRGVGLRAVCRLLRLLPRLDTLHVTHDVLTSNYRRVGYPVDDETLSALTEAVTSSQDGVHLRRLGLEHVELTRIYWPESLRLFHRLDSLHVRRCVVDVDVWRRILHGCRSTLTALSIVDVCYEYLLSDVSVPFLPVVTPRLSTLKVWANDLHDLDGLCDNAAAIAGLQRVTVSLFRRQTERTLRKLAAFGDRLELRADLDLLLDDDLTPDIRLALAVNVTHLLLVDGQRFPSTDVHRLVGQCRKLRSLTFKIFDETADVDDLIRGLLADRELTSRLRHLTLEGPVSDAVVGRLFETCTALESLRLRKILLARAVVTDQHILSWIRNGARPSDVIIVLPHTLTDRSVIPLLRCCGSNLRQFCVGNGARRITKASLRVLLEECKHVRKYNLTVGEDQVRASNSSDHLFYSNLSHSVDISE